MTRSARALCAPLVLLAGLAHAEAPVVHDPLAVDGTAATLRQAADLVESGDYGQAQSLLDALYARTRIDDDAARRLFDEGIGHLEAGRFDEARSVFGRIADRARSEEARYYAMDYLARAQALGGPVPALDAQAWLQGDAVDWSKGTVLAVFWEAWCPHCRREVPALQAVHEAWGPKGLQLVGLTRLSRDETAETALSFAKGEGVTYPIAHIGDAAADALGISGIPAAVVVQDGLVVWSGHPAELEADDYARWTGATAEAEPPKDGKRKRR